MTEIIERISVVSMAYGFYKAVFSKIRLIGNSFKGKLGFLLLLVCFTPPYKGIAIEVVCSVQPLQSVVSDLMQGVGKPKLLLSGRISPHGHHLKPGDAKVLANADVIFWVGPTLEGFLEKPLNTIAKKATAYSLLSNPHLDYIQQESPCCEGNDHDHAHHEGGIDPHIWLDPDLMIAALPGIVDVLIQKDPKNRVIYLNNQKDLEIKLHLLKKDLQEILFPSIGLGFMAYHNGYAYFARGFDLKDLGALMGNDHGALSFNRIKEIRELAKLGTLKCLFGEAQFKPAVMKKISKETGVTYGVLDPYGQGTYEEMMLTLAQEVSRCLR